MRTMMMSSSRNILHVSGPLCGEFTGQRWIPLTKASGAGLWCFLWSAPWINDWVNNRETGDLRCHRAHYDVIVMPSVPMSWSRHADTHTQRRWTQPIDVHRRKMNLWHNWLIYNLAMVCFWWNRVFDIIPLDICIWKPELNLFKY